jgi:protein O-GlcNAc transferase
VFDNLFKQIFRNRVRGHGPHAASVAAAASSDTVLTEAVRRFEMGDLAGAHAVADKLAREDPRRHQAWNLLGALAVAGGQHEHGIRQFERAIALNPANADYLSNCGEACRRAGWLDDAADHCRAALAADPRHASAHYNLALALHAMGEVETAHAALMTALEIRPDLRAARSALLFLLCHHPDFDGAALLVEHRRWNELYAAALTSEAAPPVAAPAPGRRLRIGYVSADFRRHSLAYFIEPLFANHDTQRFDVFCYSNTRRTDEVTDCLRGYVTQWRDITTLPDEAAAELVARDGIDILVDLAGHTADSRLLVFARKPAPVQISYIGYPNTTGLTAMDYRISDGEMDPRGLADSMYVEKLLRMPHSQWCYRPPAGTPAVNPLPALQRGVITFGSLHTFAKLNRKVISLWAQVLTRLADSKLLIAGAPAGDARGRLYGQFAAHGIDSSRIELVGKLNFDDYLRLYHRIDIGLDAYPYTGGTTTCESLWMGVPVVTLAGKYGVARAGASLLSGAGLAELIADSPGRYVEIAIDLARDPRRLAELRGSLRERLQRSALMAETQFTRAFEALLQGAHQAAHAGIGPRGAQPADVSR